MDPTIQLGLEVAKVVATLIAAGVAAWVAYRIGSSQRDIAARQASTAEGVRKINEAKLKLDLFEERYALFDQIWTFLSKPIDYDRITGSRPDFTNLIPKAQFLFGPDIVAYMKEAATKQTTMATLLLASNNRELTHPEREKLARLEHWFTYQAIDCHLLFKDYLDFSSWKADPPPKPDYQIHRPTWWQRIRFMFSRKRHHHFTI
jgi:hypothetical protein